MNLNLPNSFTMATDAYQQVDDLTEGLPEDTTMDDDLFGDLDDELNFDNPDGLDNNLSSSYLEQADEPPQLDEDPAPSSEQPIAELPEMPDGGGRYAECLASRRLGW